MIIKARAPLRLGLAGGGTDVSPYVDVHGGYVLNAAIDRYAYAVIRTLNDPIIQLVATDRELSMECALSNWAPGSGELSLHKAVYDHFIVNFNNGVPIPLELCTFCDAPVGSGLGTSSTLVVAMIRAFSELLNVPLDDYATASLAFRIERIDCGLQGGRQDQYSAAFGGFNFMEFYAAERVVVNSLRIKDWVLSELESSLILFFTGVSRESATIIADQSNNVHEGRLEAIDAMHAVKNEALQMKECLLRGDFEGLIQSLRVGWENKKRTARTVSNPHIDEIFNAAIKAGALAGKVSGAGGGGFMLFFVPTDRRMAVMRTLDSFQGQISNCHFTRQGAQAWRCNNTFNDLRKL